jgi:hypothetical protein
MPRYIDGKEVTEAEWLRHTRTDSAGEPVIYINGQEVVGRDPIREAIDRAMGRVLRDLADA